MLVIHYSWVVLFYVSAQLIYTLTQYRCNGHFIRWSAKLNILPSATGSTNSHHSRTPTKRRNTPWKSKVVGHGHWLRMKGISSSKSNEMMPSWPNYCDVTEIRCDQAQQQNLCLEPGIWEWRVELEFTIIAQDCTHMELLRHIIIIQLSWSFSSSYSASSSWQCS